MVRRATQPDEPTDEVDGDDVERVVVAELELQPDRQVADRAGDATSVPAAQLPFKVSERPAEPRFPGRTMMAIGPSTGGISDFPMVTLYVSFDGGEAHIEGVVR